MSRFLLVSALGLAAWVGLHSAWTVAAGMNERPRPSDIAVVLGTRVERSGVPSLRLRERLDRALELYRDGTVRHILVSGGLGREGHEEADVMREYLLARGVPPDRVLADRAGDDTFASARDTRAIMDQRGFTSAVIVSHYYHLPRAVLTFQRFGIRSVSAAAVDEVSVWRDSYNILREFAAFYFYLVRDYAAT